MGAATLDANPWQPEPPGGLGLGAGLALLAHGLLIVALALGVSWRTRPSEVTASAELWAAVPQVAAPAPVEPQVPIPPQPKPTPAPPPPAAVEREAQIAIERAEKRRREQELEEKKRQDKLREQRLQEERAREQKLREEQQKKAAAAKAEQERLARLREENLARIRGLAGATGAPQATGSATHDAAPSATYAGRIKARIKPNIVLTADVSGNPIAEVEVRCAADGRIIGRRIAKSSGNPLWDETVLRAIDRTEVLPRDVDGRVPATLLLVFPRQE